MSGKPIPSTGGTASSRRRAESCSDYLVEVGDLAKTRFKLTEEGPQLAARPQADQGKGLISVTRGASVVSRKTVTVRLKAPRRAP